MSPNFVTATNCAEPLESVAACENHTQQHSTPQIHLPRLEPRHEELEIGDVTSFEDMRIQTDIVPSRNNCIVTIHSREKALATSAIAAKMQPQLPSYDLTFWTDASLQGPKSAARLKDAPKSARGLISFCVVHRRWDVRGTRPGDQYWETLWWLSGFVATNIFSVFQAEALGVVQALKMAVHHCQLTSGLLFTTKGSRPCPKRIDVPMPKLVNIFSDNPTVVQSLGGLLDPDKHPKDKWLNEAASELITCLGKYGVGVNLQWVPGHAGDFRNELAHEGARLALHPKCHHPKVYRKQTYRVLLKARRDRRAGVVSSAPPDVTTPANEHI